MLVIDMYEHSYQMDFGAATARYVDAFFNNINWEVVLDRMTGTGQMAGKDSPIASPPTIS